jgi:cytochrome c
VVEFTMFTEEWREMIANSKFKEMPDFGKAKKGHIVLQDHGDNVWYRNLRIRKL